jgi:hypothetical protein
MVLNRVTSEVARRPLTSSVSSRDRSLPCSDIKLELAMFFRVGQEGDSCTVRRPCHRASASLGKRIVRSILPFSFSGDKAPVDTCTGSALSSKAGPEWRVPRGAPSLPTTVSTQAISFPSGEIVVCSKRYVEEGVHHFIDRRWRALRMPASCDSFLVRLDGPSQRWKKARTTATNHFKIACVPAFRNELFGDDKLTRVHLQGLPSESRLLRQGFARRIRPAWNLRT